MSRYVAIMVEDGAVEIHAASSIAGYKTLCGLDGGCAGNDQREVGVPIGAHIDCEQCFQMWQEAKRFGKRDFVASLLSRPVRATLSLPTPMLQLPIDPGTDEVKP